MATKQTDMGADRWYRAAALAVVGALAWLALASAALYLFGPSKLVGSAFLLPLTIVIPICFLLGLKLNEIRLLRQRIAQVQAEDSLTNCLTSQTFGALVDAYLGVIALGSERSQGALLVVDIDHFRGLIDQFGHGWGDQTLRVIGAIIRTAVRGGDLVGRLGGQEFGIFLPGASQENAEHVADRIRTAIAEAHFAPSGSKWPLTASIGAVLFEHQVGFEELLGEANQQMRRAKSGGRNRIEISRTMSSPPPASLH